MKRSRDKRFQVAGLAGVAIAGSVAALSPWTDAFVKLVAMRLPFKFIFTIALWAFLVLYLWKVRTSVVRDVLVGAIAGLFAAWIAIQFANLWLDDGVRRTTASLRAFGLANVVLLDLMASVILGGWLYGIVFFAMFSRLARVLIEREGRRDDDPGPPTQ